MSLIQKDENGHYKLVVSSIKNPWLRRPFIVLTFFLLTLLVFAVNVGVAAAAIIWLLARVLWSVITLEITGLPTLLGSARRVW